MSTYVSPNFRTKKALKEALARGETVEMFKPGLGSIPFNGTTALEGPHYPEPHSWYGVGTVVGGKLVSVK